MMRSFMVFLLLTASCGKGVNPNSVFSTNQNKNRVDVLTARAQVEFDRKNLSNAEMYALQAYNRNQNSEIAALQLANVAVGNANLSILDIASRISTDLKVDNTSSTKNTQALDVLGVLIDLVPLTDTDYTNLGKRNVSSISYFKNLDVIEPYSPGSYTDTTSPRYKVLSLRKLNQAIAILCPFVDPNITDGLSDPRYNCTKVTDSTITARAQVHFAYAMAHLLEALIFNSILEYSNNVQSTTTASSASENSNLYKRVLALQNVKFTTTTANSYLDAIGVLVENVTSVFDVSTGSMLQETMIDLRVTEQALVAIKGFPPSLISKIQDVQTTIQKAVSDLGKTVSDITNQTEALKAQLSKSVVNQLNASIGSYLNTIPSADKQNQTTKDQISAICAKYTSIVDQFLKSLAVPAKPTGC